VPLLERTEPLSALAAWWGEACAGHGLVALVAGEAGIGKTSLVREFGRTVAAPGRMLLGACDALSTPRPLGPLHDIASALPGELSRALAESRPPDSTFTILGTELRSEHPTLLVFEDVHWADAATLDLLRFLGRRIRTMRVLLVLTYRDDEVGPKHPLRIVIGDLASAGELKRIGLGPLSAEAVDRLADGSRLDARTLHAHTGGNPFFVTEVLAAATGGVPANVRDAVLARAARLDAAARNTLEAAAVIGAGVELALLGEVVAADLALDRCLEAGMLSAVSGTVVFRHEIARQTILSALAPDARLRWHARILAALRARKSGAADPATLSHHAEGALDGAAVLELAPAAARQAAALRSHRESAAQYRRALAFAGALAPFSRADLLEAYSYECYLTDQLSEAIAARSEAAALREELGDGTRYGDDQRWLSRFHWWAGNKDAAEGAGRRAIEALEELGPSRELAGAYSNFSQLRMLAGEAQAAIRWGKKALSLARRRGDTDLEAHALNNVGTSRLNLGDRRGASDLERSLELSLAHGFEDHAARAYNNLVSSDVLQRRLVEGDRWLKDGISYDHERGLDAHRCYLLGWQAVAQLYQGRVDEAVESARQALSNPHLSIMLRINPLCVMGRVRARRGDPEAWTALDEAMELADRIGELQRIGPARIARSEAAWLEGDDERARHEAEQALPLALERFEGAGWIAGELLLCIARAGGKVRVPAKCPGPIVDQLRGRAAKAARAFAKLGCPFEAALARSETGREEDVRAAFSELERLGMRAAAARQAQRLREMGARKIPRGRRASTRAHPQGLTSREVEILAMLGDGLRNAEIGRRLFISPKTVDHHVSAILGKLGVSTRAEAARWLKKGGPSAI
jgi:DNA-binding CsgD family transcriptional regulator/tetratricopeptide (TPR) repeat protein